MLVSSFLIQGCTTVPDRFTTTAGEADCGHRTESMSEVGFALEVFLKKYSFLPAPDEAIVAGRKCFARTAQNLAELKGKKIIALTLADMSASATRNTMDGVYSVYVTGNVRYAP